VSSKKKLLLQAQETLTYNPLHERDGDIKMFLKDDKYHHTSRVAQYLGGKSQMIHLALHDVFNTATSAIACVWQPISIQ